MKKLTLYTVGTVFMSGLAFGSDTPIVNSDNLRNMFGSAPIDITRVQDSLVSMRDDKAMDKAMNESKSGAEEIRKEGTHVKSMKADGEGSLVIGMNGVALSNVEHVSATDMGISLVSNQAVINLEGETADICISSESTLSHKSTDVSHVEVGEMTASDGGIAIGTNTGTITIKRKKKNG